MKHTKWFIGLLLTAVLLAALAGGCAAGPSKTPEAPSAPQSAEAKTGPFKGMRAPDFTLKDLDGTSWQLSELKGNSVALIFFTSW